MDGYDPHSLGTYAEAVDELVETATPIVEADKDIPTVCENCPFVEICDDRENCKHRKELEEKENEIR